MLLTSRVDHSVILSHIKLLVSRCPLGNPIMMMFKHQQTAGARYHPNAFCFLKRFKGFCERPPFNSSLRFFKYFYLHILDSYLYMIFIILMIYEKLSICMILFFNFCDIYIYIYQWALTILENMLGVWIWFLYFESQLPMIYIHAVSSIIHPQRSWQMRRKDVQKCAMFAV